MTRPHDRLTLAEFCAELRISRSTFYEWRTRVWSIDLYKGTTTTTYYARWKVAGARFKQGFKSRALADSFRSQLVTAARSGEAFSISTGLPVSMSRKEETTSWYEFACSYVDMKWPDMAGKSRMGIAETLATITPVLTTGAGRPEDSLCVARSTPGRSAREPGRPGRHRASWADRSAGWRAIRDL